LLHADVRCVVRASPLGTPAGQVSQPPVGQWLLNASDFVGSETQYVENSITRISLTDGPVVDGV
jgi:hypothetical protein